MLVKHPFFKIFFTIFLGMLQSGLGRNDTETKKFVFLFFDLSFPDLARVRESSYWILYINVSMPLEMQFDPFI